MVNKRHLPSFITGKSKKATKKKSPTVRKNEK